MKTSSKYNMYIAKNQVRCFIESEIDRFFYQPHNKTYHYEPNRTAFKKIMDRKETNSYIASSIQSGEPFWAARYGHTELTFIQAVLCQQMIGKGKAYGNASMDVALNMLYNNAGFFPKDISLARKYSDLILSLVSEIDLHATWELYMEDYIIAQYEKKALLTRWSYIAPFYNRKENGDLPWTYALAGKKVLVVNPFADTIEYQYKNNREKLFAQIYPSHEILPQFELKTLKSVQTVADAKDERFLNWFEALDWMIEECKKIDFDVALIGCGAYGMPLAAEIKKMGKCAIQTCGCTQMMFGVLGHRWESDEKLMQEVVNDAWIHPPVSEIPKGFESVDFGCYW